MAGVTSTWWPARFRFMLLLLARLDGFAQADGWYLQRFPVFRHGAARHDDALPGQNLRELAVGKRFAAVFRADQLFDQGANRGRRAGATGFGGHMASEEMLQLVAAARGEQVFLGGDPRYRRFVQADCLGDFAQNQRAHGNLAVFEEMLLALDDGLGNPQDGVEALLDVLDQPARFLQLAAHLLAAAATVALQDIRVHAVDPEARHGFRVQRR